MIQNSYCDLKRSLWWKLIIVIKIGHCKNHQCNENSSGDTNLSSECVMRNLHCDKNAYLWQKKLTGMKVHHCHENSQFWWNIIIVNKIETCDENSLQQGKEIKVKDHFSPAELTNKIRLTVRWMIWQLKSKFTSSKERTISDFQF